MPSEARPPIGERDAHGWVEELEKLPESLPAPRPSLPLIGRRIETARGPGKLWDVKAKEARVVLASDPSRWVGLDLSELTLEGAA